MAVSGGDTRRLVILRALGLGDLLTGIPALRALARHYPDHRRTLLTPAALAPLVDLAGREDTGPVVHEMLDHSGLTRLPDSVRGADVAVNLHGSGPESHRLLEAAHPGSVIAFRTPGFDTGPGWDPQEHERNRWCRLLRHHGIAADPADFRLASPGAGPGAVASGAPVVIHPGAASPARRWPAVRWAAVAAEIRASGKQVLVTGTEDEIELASSVIRMAGLPPTSMLAGRTGLTALAALVDGACLVLCGDTGTAHLATAFATPSVVLFGPTPPSLWGPPEDGPHISLWKGETGDPHAESPDPGLLRITVDEVLAAINRLEPSALRRDPGIRQVPA